MSDTSSVSVFEATLPDWITALGIVCSSVVAIIVRSTTDAAAALRSYWPSHTRIPGRMKRCYRTDCHCCAMQGYLMDRNKARATEEANSRLERQSRELEAQAKLRHMCERAELDRCRLQMSEFIGPVRTYGRSGHARHPYMINTRTVRNRYAACPTASNLRCCCLTLLLSRDSYTDT